MRIERADSGDAPPRPRDGDGDSPVAERPAVPPETRDRHTYHAEYRATVEAEYRAAREGQSASPERTSPSPQPDVPGAWRGDGGRYLAPDANAEISKGRERIHEIGKNDIVPPIREIEAEDPGRHLAGFESRFKDPERIKEKVADDIRYKGRTPGEALANLKDAVRFTFVYPEESYTAGVRADCDRLRERGFERFDRVNTWHDEEYKGINGRWREPSSGQIFEVQFHTRASFEAKELTHKAYERLRCPATTDTEREELHDFQRTVSAKVPIPPGATEIESYGPEKRDA